MDIERKGLSIRAKVFMVTVFVVMLVDLAAGLFLEHQLGSAVEARIEGELLRHARSGRDFIESAHAVPNQANMDPLADSLGDSMGARVSIILKDGTVIGDSQRTPLQLDRLDNHGQRPEVLEAHKSGHGMEKRFSATVNEELLYVAVPFQGHEDSSGVAGTIRVAMRTQEVADAIHSLRIVLVIAGLLAVLLAISVAAFVSGRIAEQLRRLVESANEARGSQREGSRSQALATETGTHGSSIPKLALDLQTTVHALAVERDRFQTVLKSMDEAVLAIDEKYMVTAANPAAREMLLVRGAMEGRALMEVIRIPDLEKVAGEALEGKASSSEVTVYADSPRTLAVRALPQVSSEQGQVEGAVLVLRDVTEVRQLETVRQDFVANVSHELRTPVSIIQAHTETLLDGAMNDVTQARRFLEPIGRSAERLGQLIADLLDISRIDRGKYDIELQNIPIADVFQVVKENLERSSGSSVHIETRSSDGASVMADRQALEQVLINLVQNALKYGPQDGLVTVVATSEGDKTVL